MFMQICLDMNLLLKMDVVALPPPLPIMVMMSNADLRVVMMNKGEKSHNFGTKHSFVGRLDMPRNMVIIHTVIIKFAYSMD